MGVNDSNFFVHRIQTDIKKISVLDLRQRSQILGCTFSEQGLEIEFYHRHIDVRVPKFIDRKGYPVTDAVKSVLTRYIVNCPDKAPEKKDRLISFREFPGAGPLVYRFTANTSKIVETQFSDNIKGLQKKCIALGGCDVEKAGFDLAVRFRALPRVPILFLYNGPEDGLPPSASFLFSETAILWLDIQGLMTITTYLTGSLIRSALQ